MLLFAAGTKWTHGALFTMSMRDSIYECRWMTQMGWDVWWKRLPNAVLGHLPVILLVVLIQVIWQYFRILLYGLLTLHRYTNIRKSSGIGSIKPIRLYWGLPGYVLNLLYTYCLYAEPDQTFYQKQYNFLINIYIYYYQNKYIWYLSGDTVQIWYKEIKRYASRIACACYNALT